MKSRKLVLIQKDDNKSFKWAEAAKESDIELLPQPGSPIKAPLFLLQTALRRGVPAGYVVRYLNDYASLAKTLLRLLSEMALVAFCTLLRIKLFWICHNVDKESSAHYPRISGFRRWMFAAMAKRIFVTDPLLVPHAKEHFPAHTHKIEGITFGEIQPEARFDKDRQNQAIAFIENKKQQAEAEGKTPLVLFCTGAPAKKSLHFDYMEDLLAAGQKNGYRIIAIVAGGFMASERGKELLVRYKSHPDICVYETFTRFSSDFIRQYVDFYWRGYDDWSVPFTVYEAATLGKPIIALDTGFLPELVRGCGLGCVISLSDLEVGSFLDCLSSVSSGSFGGFLADREWGVLSRKLKEAF